MFFIYLALEQKVKESFKYTLTLKRTFPYIPPTCLDDLAAGL